MNCGHMDHLISDDLFLPTDYIKLRQDSKITCLYTLLPPPREANLSERPAESVKRGPGRPRRREALPEVIPLENGTFKIAQVKACVYIENYEEVTAHSNGSYRLNTYRLLDFLVWQLDVSNRPPGSEDEYISPLCTQLTLPLEQYIRCCGYEAEITASKRKDSQKEVQKDLRLLCATQIGWDDGGAVRILDTGCVRNGQIIVDFSQRMAAHLLQKCPYMWYPLKLMQLSGKSLLSYSLGRSMALHSSIINNQWRGTDQTYSVRRLLQYCRSLPTLDEVQARNGNYRQAIIRPFTAALDRLEDLEIIGWSWKINEGEEFPKNYNDFLKEAVKYSMAGMPEGA